MARGKARVNYLGRAGLVASADAPDWSFIYETSKVKSSHYNLGDRVVLPDGRVFRYAKASNIIQNIQQGVKFYGLKTDGVSYKSATACAIGDKKITIDAGNVGDYTADQLRGGYIIIHTHGDYNHQFRGIVGNTASDADGNITIYLDGPLTHTITSSHGVEVSPNPYANVRRVAAEPATDPYTDVYTSIAGIPAVATAAANQHLWIQTWGPCWVNPYGSSLQGAGSAADERRVVFDYEGNICIEEDAGHGGGAATDDHQYAGFLINRSSVGVSAGQLVMLQISC